MYNAVNGNELPTICGEQCYGQSMFMRMLTPMFVSEMHICEINHMNVEHGKSK